ncbi:uncharacterized protein LOC127010027 [Eriocheir sinensis]|uniref:uncharacterized protein LOC127010027 n=1 Tax=Eriocheir sinensis TaxID=95602 RepID=UPI0021C7FA6E|nr:uncharacterized protein LOC127010027 [Eriocheir sinensis]
MGASHTSLLCLLSLLVACYLLAPTPTLAANIWRPHDLFQPQNPWNPSNSWKPQNTFKSFFEAPVRFGRFFRDIFYENTPTRVFANTYHTPDSCSWLFSFICSNLADTSGSSGSRQLDISVDAHNQK